MYKEFAVTIAKEAGDIMRQNFSSGMKKDWKEDNSPLTATDIAINALVIERVVNQFPEHAVLGEEDSTEAIEGKSHVWVVDPVDGTIPFSHGVPTFAFSLALVVDGESVLGVVYDPILDRLFVAEKGKGATMNGEQIHVNTQDLLPHSVMNIDGPWSKTGAAEVNFFALPQALHEEKVKITKFSCMVYGGLLVALGEYGAAICSGKYPWDIAALKVIIEEAGGKVTNLRGEEQRYDRPLFGAIMSNGLLHDRVVEIVKEAAI